MFNRFLPIAVGIAFCAFGSASLAADSPCGIFFYGRYTAADLTFEQSIVDEFEIETDAAQSSWLKREEFFRYDVPDGFVKREGIAYYWMRDSQTLRVVRFLPMPDKRAFLQYVEQVSRQLGDDTTVTGSKNVRELRSPGGNHRLLRYDERGIAVTGWDASAKTMTLDPLVAAMREVSGKHSLYSIRLDAVPKDQRVAFLKQIAAQQSVTLQQRDDEADDSYSIRRLLGEAWQEMTNVALLELNEVTFWFSLPRKFEPMRLSVTARFKKDGRIDKVVQRFSRNRRSMVVSDEALASVTLACALTESELAFAQTLSTRLPKEWRPVADAILTRNFEFTAVVSDLGIGEPVVAACSPSKSGLSAAAMSALEIPHVGELTPVVGPDKIGSTNVTGIQLASQRIGRTAIPLDDVFFAVRPSRGPLLEAKLRLSKWISNADSSGTRELLQNLERLYDYWEHRKLVSGIPKNLHPRMRAQLYPYKSKQSADDFRSLLPFVKDQKGWDADLELIARGPSLVLNLEVGPSLYRWFAARQVIARMRARKIE